LRHVDGKQPETLVRIITMAMTPAYALAHVFLPNLLRLKGHATVMSALERRDLIYFDPLWAQAQVAHNPFVLTQHRESMSGDKFRIATMTLPVPTEMGEAHMAGIVVKANDPAFLRYFTLEHDFVLAKQASRTLLCERSGQKHSRIGDGPALTGNAEADAKAFMDCFMELMIPTKVTKR
jgi:hypothetical protein